MHQHVLLFVSQVIEKLECLVHLLHLVRGQIQDGIPHLVVVVDATRLSSVMVQPDMQNVFRFYITYLIMKKYSLESWQ